MQKKDQEEGTSILLATLRLAGPNGESLLCDPRAKQRAMLSVWANWTAWRREGVQ